MSPIMILRKPVAGSGQIARWPGLRHSRGDLSLSEVVHSTPSRSGIAELSNCGELQPQPNIHVFSEAD